MNMWEETEFIRAVQWKKLSSKKGYKSSQEHQDSGIKNFYLMLAPKKWYQKKSPLYTLEQLRSNCKRINDEFHIFNNSDEFLDKIIKMGGFAYWNIRQEIDKQCNIKYRVYYEYDDSWMYA